MTDQLRIIGLMGKSMSGKDTVASMLLNADAHGAKLAFSDKLKEVCRDLFGFTPEDVDTEEGKNRVTDFPCYKCPACGSIDAEKVSQYQAACKGCNAAGEIESFKSAWTVRMAMQHLGIEGVRRIDENAWTRHAFDRAKGLLASPFYKFAVITDCRFKSEAEAIWKAGGEVWRIRRPSTDHRTVGIVRHPSETEMDSIPDASFQSVIVNDGTLDNLRDKALESLKRFRESYLLAS